MRVLFLSPWFRTLAVGWADGLRRRGHDVRVVTTAQHFDPPPVAHDDIVFQYRWRTPAGVAEAVRAAHTLSTWRPDVVVSDPVRDPRWLALSLLGRRQLVTTHDARPHDSAHRSPLLRRINTRILMRRADAEIVFSDHVRDVLGPRGHDVVPLPLASEMPERDVPAFVPAAERRDFLVLGRLSPYKNVGTIVRAFERHRRSSAYRGDRLIVIGGGDPGVDLPDHVQHISERFRFSEVAPRLAAAKASICLYSSGSQSGVQVWAMQCGTASLVSEVGALSEYLPAGERSIRHDDSDALADALDRMSEPDVAEAAGRLHREEYERRLTPDIVAERWEQVLTEVTSEPRRG